MKPKTPTDFARRVLDWFDAHGRHDLPWLDNACRQCARPLHASRADALCGHCQRQAPAFDRTTALFHYRPPVDHLIRRFKFAEELQVGSLLSRLLAARLAAPSTDPETINRRLDAVGHFVAEEGLRANVRGALKAAPDLERALARRIPSVCFTIPACSRPGIFEKLQ